MSNEELLKHLESLSQLVENSPGFMGKRLVDEEKFFKQMLIIHQRFAADESGSKRETPPTAQSP